MSASSAPPRLQFPDRHQLRFETLDLDALIEDDHPARATWAWVERLDLSPLLDAIKARGSSPGRAAIDPRILVCLWLYANLEGIGSARLLDRLCRQHNAFRWISGGVSLNYHTLSDFRTAHLSFLDRLLTDSMALLIEQGLVRMKTVAQDGVRVRAAAGRSSFRRKETLEKLREECRAQVETLKEELERDPDAATLRQKAARQRSVRERQERVEKALATLEQLEKSEKKDKAGEGPQKPPSGGSPATDAAAGKKKKEPRASTTDADARVMKMANGGWDPAWNVQFVTDAETRLVVGLDVGNGGTDYGQMLPLQEQLEERYRRRAEAVVADGGYVELEDITGVERGGTRVCAPPKKTGKIDSRFIKARDTAESRQWRERMESEEGKALYRVRGSVAEWVNAQARNHGLRQFLVRGVEKVKAVVLWHVLAQNLRQMWHLGLA